MVVWVWNHLLTLDVLFTCIEFKCLLCTVFIRNWFNNYWVDGLLWHFGRVFISPSLRMRSTSFDHSLTFHTVSKICLSKNLIWYQAPAKRTTLPSASSVLCKKSPILQTTLSLLNVICCTCSTTGAVFTTYVGILVFSAPALIWSFSLIIRDVKISQQGKD